VFLYIDATRKAEVGGEILTPDFRRDREGLLVRYLNCGYNSESEFQEIKNAK
jgi:hypothetical protein